MANDSSKRPLRERRGFALLSPEQRRQIASKGGRRAHELGRAHQWTPEEAAVAGRKGGISSRGGRGQVLATENTDGQ